MITLDIQELKDFLINFSDELRQKAPSPYFDGALMVVGKELQFLHEAEQKGEVRMKNLKEGLKVAIMTMGDMPQRQRESFWPGHIKEQIEKLNEAINEWKKSKGSMDEKPAIRLESNGVRVEHLSNVVSKLKKAGEIPTDVRVLKRGETIWMVRA